MNELSGAQAPPRFSVRHWRRGLSIGALVVLSALVAGGGSTAAAATGFDSVAPIFRQHCVVCHSGPAAVLGLRLDSYDGVIKGSERQLVVRPGDPEASELLRRIRGQSLPRMPLTGPPFLADDDVATLVTWIAGGALRGTGVAAAPAAQRLPARGETVNFSDVAPILLQRCVKCHGDNSIMGAPPEGLRLSSLDLVLRGSERAVVVPGSPLASELFRRIAGHAQPRMPFDGPPYLSDDEIRVIGDWIAQGARNADGQPSPLPVGAPVRLHGRLTGRWAVDGLDVGVGAGTRIDKSPRIGDAVELRGVVAADGSIDVQRLRRR